MAIIGFSRATNADDSSGRLTNTVLTRNSMTNHDRPCRTVRTSRKQRLITGYLGNVSCLMVGRFSSRMNDSACSSSADNVFNIRYDGRQIIVQLMSTLLELTGNGVRQFLAIQCEMGKWHSFIVARMIEK